MKDNRCLTACERYDAGQKPKMNSIVSNFRRCFSWPLLLALTFTFLLSCSAADSPKPATESAKPASAAGMVPLDLNLPAPAFKGTPKDQDFGPNVEPYDPDKPR